MSAQSTSAATVDDVVVVRDIIDPGQSRRSRLTGAGVILAVGLFCLLGFGVGAHAHRKAVFGISPAIGARFNLPPIKVPGETSAMVLGVVILLIGAYYLFRGFPRSAHRWVVTAVLLCTLLAFLCWAATGGDGQTIDMVGLMQQAVISAVPLILGALGGIVCERSGVINVAIEGQMLMGAWAGALVGSLAHNLGIGLVAALVAGGLLGAVLAVFAIRYLVNQVILGVVLNLLALGITGFIYDAVMQGNPDGTNSSNNFSPIAIPGLSDIPIIGPVLFDANIIVYIMYALIVVVDVALFRTRWGLRTRAVGEHPMAADTVGINVLATRYRNVILGGLIAGLAGAFLTIGNVGSFTKNISSGKGFIALAAVIFGRWSPRGAIGAALLFGFADALQTVLSIVGTPVTIPSQFMAMLPYVATIFAVAGLVGRVRAPAADGEPYVKQ